MGWTCLNRTSSGPGWTGQFSEWTGLDGLLKIQMGLISMNKDVREVIRRAFRRHSVQRSSTSWPSWSGLSTLLRRRSLRRELITVQDALTWILELDEWNLSTEDTAELHGFLAAVANISLVTGCRDYTWRKQETGRRVKCFTFNKDVGKSTVKAAFGPMCENSTNLHLPWNFKLNYSKYLESWADSMTPYGLMV